MWSQLATASLLLVALWGCGARREPPPAAPQQGSLILSLASTPRRIEQPDLHLREVAFARMADGRIVARGIARELDYRRSGGWLAASEGEVALQPEPGSGLSPLGLLHIAAPEGEGEVAGHRVVLQGGVTLVAARGDRARTERVQYDGRTVRSDRDFEGNGPGYRVRSKGLVASADGSAITLTDGVVGRLEPHDAPPPSRKMRRRVHR